MPTEYNLLQQQASIHFHLSQWPSSPVCWGSGSVTKGVGKHFTEGSCISQCIVSLSLPQDSCNAPACSCKMEPAGTHVSHYSIKVWYKVAELIWTGLRLVYVLSLSSSLPLLPPPHPISTHVCYHPTHPISTHVCYHCRSVAGYRMLWTSHVDSVLVCRSRNVSWNCF